jgi:hypothetical protein
LKKAIPGSDLSTEGRRKLSAPADAPGRGMTQETAQELAVRAFVFLAVDANRARRFAAATGLGPENMRNAAESPDFLQGILDYFAADESLLLTFTANCGIDPADVHRARIALSRLAEE